MRALFLTTEVGGVGGVQYAGRLFLRALQDCLGDGSRITLVSLKDTDAALGQVAAGCEVFGGGSSRVRTGLTVLRQLRRRSWDLIVLGHLNLAPLLLTRLNSPVLALVYGIEGWQPIRGLRRRGLRRAAQLLYISRHTEARSRAANPWLGCTPGQVCYLGLLAEPGGQPTLPTPAGQALAGSPGQAPFALAIGRMACDEGYKGQEELIRIWPEVERLRPGFRLVLLGDGDDRSRLQDLAGGLRCRVEFLGRVDDATRDAYLRQCRCFCLPSRGEGFGLVYLEAMHAGKPVLAGSADAGREVVVDGVTGRTVNPADPAELLHGLLDVSGERAESMGQAGRQRFHEHFTYEKFRERFSRLVRQVLAGTEVLSG